MYELLTKYSVHYMTFNYFFIEHRNINGLQYLILIVHLLYLGIIENTWHQIWWVNY